jgi:starvation-inducible DNA-binding protein
MVEHLNQALAESIDLHAQIKTAHWNVRGPLFSTLHPLFETFAVSLNGHIDIIAERVVVLGGTAGGSLQSALAASRLPVWPQQTRRDLACVAHLASAMEAWLQGLGAVRASAEELRDVDTADLLTGMISEFEKHHWFLAATLDS